MLQKQMSVPVELAELVAWFVETVQPLVGENGWSVTVNGSAYNVVTDVKVVERIDNDEVDMRIERRLMRQFKLKRRNGA